MDIQKNIILAPYTTFHVGGPAKFFCAPQNVDELKEAIQFAKDKSMPVFILGGGSNIVVRDSGFNGLVIHWTPKRLKIIADDDQGVQLQIGAGEVWDDVVAYTVNNNWWGIENLSHIPGLSGSLAVQNVGAYGQEASKVVVSVEVLDTERDVIKSITNEQCQFGYRKSIFNTTEKGRYVILNTILKFSKIPQTLLAYGDVKKYLVEHSIIDPTQQQIRQAIIEIRDRKFPFPKEAKNGNAGSFFRGPILEPFQIEHLFQQVGSNFGAEALEKLHTMSDRLMVDQGLKTPTAFLIELCGLRGLQIGGARVHDQHAAIMTNATGQATSKDIVNLFKQVAQTVLDRTGVLLHIEPELIGWSEAEKTDILEL